MTNFFEKEGSYSFSEPQQFIKPIVHSVATGLVATGSAITDALDLTAAINNFATVAASTGAQLPNSDVGAVVYVRNGGANALTVYPPSASEAINAASDGAGVAVAATEIAFFAKVSATKWIGGVAVTF